MAQGIISPLIKGNGDSKTLTGSLISNGYVRAPGASLLICPNKEKGVFVTGLDENAFYIKEMSEEDAKIERARVKSWREKCEKFYNVDLSPSSPFYTEMFLMKKDQPYCPIYKLHPKEDNIFDLDIPEQLVIYAYIRVNKKFVSPSYDAYFTGKIEDPEQVSYYVKDEIVENEKAYNRNKEMNNALKVLNELSETKRKIIARCLGLGVSENTPLEVVYNLLDTFVKQGMLEKGYFKGKEAISLFMSFVDMKADNLDILNTINKALEYNIYREDRRTGTIRKGDVLVGENKQAALEYLLSEDGADLLIAVKSEIQTKEKVVSK